MSRFDQPSPFDRPRPRPEPAPWLPLLIILLLVVVAIPVAAVWWLWPHLGGGGQAPEAVPRTVTPRGDLAQDEKTTIDIYRKDSPSVVNVTSLNFRHTGIG